MKKEYIRISEATLKRLPKYLQLLKRYKNQSSKNISASVIARELKIDPIVVRKDIQSTGIIGKPKIGFDLEELVISITKFLNWDNSTDAFLIGAGGLGQAIMGYRNFRNYGLNIIAAFDNDPEKYTEKIHDIQIYPTSKLNNLVERMKIKVAVITVPAFEAQAVTDKLIAAGVKGIWNFAPVHLKVPTEIVLENVSLSQSLAVFSHRLADKLQKEETTI